VNHLDPQTSAPLPGRFRARGLAALARVACGACLLAITTAWAGPTVSYTATQVSANSWLYDYTVSGPIDLFGGLDIVFSYASYANLVGTSSGPSLLFNQPDAITPLDGDVFALFDTAALADGSTASFSVGFDWLGSGAPGGQSFSVFDAVGGFVASGTTSPTSIGTIPEPSSASMFALALALAGLVLSRRARA
jgi:hypothetical protein